MSLILNRGQMEELIQILIFVGAMVIAVVGQNAKNKKKPTTASPQEVLEDVFPEIIVEGENEMPVQPVAKPTPARKKKNKNTPSNRPVTPSIPPQKTVQSNNKISIRHRGEAKRAFIYSEIFNRKY